MNLALAVIIEAVPKIRIVRHAESRHRLFLSMQKPGYLQNKIGRKKMNLKDYMNESSRVSLKLSDYDKSIQEIMKILKTARDEKKHVYFAGIGGSAGTASHSSSDFFKLGGLRSVCLCDNASLMTAITNDEGWAKLFTEQLERFMEKGDVLVTFSVHGGKGEYHSGLWSQNLIGAIQLAKSRGCKTIGISGFDGGAMKDMCDVCIVIPSDSTPIVESFHSLLSHYITFELNGWKWK
jgi:D-sedoheptulose 7-phosphate isomerase